jgi:hypothetical protein
MTLLENHQPSNIKRSVSVSPHFSPSRNPVSYRVHYPDKPVTAHGMHKLLQYLNLFEEINNVQYKKSISPDMFAMGADEDSSAIRSHSRSF